MNKSSFELNGGNYRTVGDYRIPNITLPAEASKPLGVWSLKRKDYLMQHKRVQFNIMLVNGTLWNHLAEIDKQVSDMFSRLVEQMKVNESVTEQLKEQNQMEWVSRMNNIESRVREIVNNDLIYCRIFLKEIWSKTIKFAFCFFSFSEHILLRTNKTYLIKVNFARSRLKRIS